MPTRSIKVLFPCAAELSPDRINMNWTQRVLFVPSWVDLQIVVARDTKISIELPPNVEVIRPAFPGVLGFLLTAGRLMSLSRFNDVDIVMTERSAASLLAAVFRRLGGFRWVMDIWDAPHKELVAYHRMPRGTKGRLRSLASTLKVAALRRTSGRADLVAVSLLPAALADYNIPRGRVVQFKNAIVLSGIPPSEPPSARGPIVCFVSRLILRDRRIDLLIEAVQALDAEGIDLTVRIAGFVPGDTAREIDDSLVSHRFELLGTVSVETAHALMSEARVGLLPLEANDDLSFIFPVKLLEYMAYGCVVVASDLDGVRHIVQDEEEALLVSPGDSLELADALRSALTDDEFADRLARRAHEQMRQYDASRKATELYETVAQIVGSNR